ncbi:kelch domain-containing protein 3-like [Oppia nitens]|uniref:kelch domain-containing protein 3-like n=1 Tax=Oppia nitens TaxID=1686743 RepID=UPI0023DB8002|nr:kelch domain-containing protein 3-like [Oppia nitens]
MYWTIHLEGGPRRVNHAAVSVGTNVYSFGGYCTGDNYGHCKPIDCHILDTETLRWRPCLPSRLKARQQLQQQSFAEFDPHESNIPFQRYGHTVVVNGDLIYLWGGRNDNCADDTLYCFDTASGEWLDRPKVSGRIPGARDGHTAVSIDNKMYIFGGYEELTERFSNDIYVLDMTTFVWKYVTASGQPPTWRDFHSAVAYEDRMYVFGGRSDRSGPNHSQHEVYCNELMYFNTTTNTWIKPSVTNQSSSQPPPCGRRSHSSFVYQNMIYIFGGYNGLDRQHFNDLYQFDPRRQVWSLVDVRGRHRPCARRRQCCCVVGDRLYLFGGTSPYPASLCQTYALPQMIDVSLRDHSDLYVLDFKPTLKTLTILVAIDKELIRSYLPKNIQLDIEMMTRDNNVNRDRSSPNQG